MSDLAQLIPGLPDHVQRNILRLIAPPITSAGDQHNASLCVDAPRNGAAPGAACLPLQEALPGPLVAGASITDGVLTTAQIEAAAAEAEAYLLAHGTPAGMGSSGSGGRWHDPNSRGDINAWVKREELAGSYPVLEACLGMLTQLRPLLQEQGYNVQGRCSFQIACYPGGGSRYRRHADRRGPTGRQITALLYLNAAWDTQAHGGSLVLYNMSSSCSNQGAGLEQGEPGLVVSPLGGRLLLFESHLEHEVLPAHRYRYSITTWFYDDVVDPEPLVAGLSSSAVSTGTSSHAPGCPTGDSSRQGTSMAGTAGTPAANQGTTEPQAQHPTPSAVNPATAAAPVHECGAAAAAAPAAAPAAAAAAREGTLSAAGAAVGAAAAAAAASSQLAEQLQVAVLAKQPRMLARVLVCIASLRDPETRWTLRDVFVQAAAPERVFVAVAWQMDEEADAGLMRMAGGTRTAHFASQVRKVVVPWQAADGPCRPRFLAQQLWQGEEYVLQLDAHMRLVPGWDVLCVEQLAAAQQCSPTGKAVLSTYPLGYTGEGAAASVPEDAPATLLCASRFDQQGMLRTAGRCLVDRPARPLPSRFWAAGLSFAPAAWLLEVPYCPHLPHLFFGEEMYQLARMWTRGWEVFAPSTPIAFHQWERSARPSSYQASIQVDQAARQRSLLQVKEVLGMGPQGNSSGSSSAAAGGPSPPSVPGPSTGGSSGRHLLAPPTAPDWQPGGVWGLGTDRSLEAWQTWMGVDLAKQQVTPAAVWGGLQQSAFQEGLPA